MSEFNYTDAELKAFWALVDKNGPVPTHCPELGPCWVWRGVKISTGYGSFCSGNVKRLAHRVSYHLAKGDLQSQLKVSHKCDNRVCVRPDHLFQGTQSDNMQDAQSKGRTRGIFAPSKLSWEKVREIRKLHAQGDGGYVALGKKFGINTYHVRDIIKNISWKESQPCQN